MVKSSRRDTFEIISDLLLNMKEHKRITHLLYSSNLSYKQLVKHLKIVKQMGLAKEQEEPFHSYIITNEGQFFIQLVKKREESN